MSSFFTNMPDKYIRLGFVPSLQYFSNSFSERSFSKVIVRNYKLHTDGFFAFASGNEDGQQLALCRCAVRQMMHDKKIKVKKKEN